MNHGLIFYSTTQFYVTYMDLVVVFSNVQWLWLRYSHFLPHRDIVSEHDFFKLIQGENWCQQILGTEILTEVLNDICIEFKHFLW